MNHRPIGFAIAAALFVIDQVVKWIVVGPLDLMNRGVITILPIFDLKFVPNHGVSMGLLTAGSDTERWALVGLTAVIASAVVYFLWREKSRGDVIAFGMVLGGALGNIVDRVRFGYVVDYADLHFGDIHPFLVFNVADAAITIGVLLLVLRAFFAHGKDDPAEKVKNA